MLYEALAASLVTASLALLALESRGHPTDRATKGFLLLYGAGVGGWLVLSVLMDRPGLALISLLQLFTLAIVNDDPKH